MGPDNDRARVRIPKWPNVYGNPCEPHWEWAKHPDQKNPGGRLAVGLETKRVTSYRLEGVYWNVKVSHRRVAGWPFSPVIQRITTQGSFFFFPFLLNLWKKTKSNGIKVKHQAPELYGISTQGYE